MSDPPNMSQREHEYWDEKADQAGLILTPMSDTPETDRVKLMAELDAIIKRLMELQMPEAAYAVRCAADTRTRVWK